MRKVIFIFFALVFLASNAFAAASSVPLREMKWPFDGVFGYVDKQSAQRGYQVYKEVCASCHAMSLISFRNLKEIGFSEDEVKAIAAEYNVTDGPNVDGDMYERPARPSDSFVSPFPNEEAARAANGGAYPLDLSLIVKSRPDGANYLYSLLVGYNNPPEGFELGEGMYYNTYYPGNQIAMPSPLSEGAVEYQDGMQSSVNQMSIDLVNFLQWAAEPEMERRKLMGVKVMIYLSIFTLLFYFAKRRIWSRLEDN